MQGAVGEAGTVDGRGRPKAGTGPRPLQAQPTEEFAESAGTSGECGPALGGGPVTATPPTTVPELSVTRVLPRQPPWHSSSVTSVKTASPWRAPACVPEAPVSGLSPWRRAALGLGLGVWNNVGPHGRQRGCRPAVVPGTPPGRLPGSRARVRASHVVGQTRTRLNADVARASAWAPWVVGWRLQWCP